MHTPDIRPLERLLHRVARGVVRHPGWMIYPQIVLFGLCVAFASWQLEFRTDRNVLISTDDSYHRHWVEMREEFEAQEDLVTLVESEHLEKNRQFVERLATRLEAEPKLLTNIFFKGDLRTSGPKGLFFLPEPRLVELLQALRDYEPLIGTFSEITNLTSLFSTINRRMRAAGSEEVHRHPLTKALPVLTRIVEQGVESLERSGVPPSPGLTALFAAGGDPAPGEYLHFAEGRFYVVTCNARDESVEESAILRLRELVRETRMEVPGVNAGVTGQPVLRYEEKRQAGSDTTLASLVALAAVSIIFVVAYREVRRPLKATACLVVGIGYTLGFAALTVGHLNILTITVVPILLGLAIDFGVHLITRFEEELRAGRSAQAGIEKALVVCGKGICTSGLATAAAFLAMMLTGFKGIREMGLISGGGLLLCLIPMLTLLPALLLRGKPERPHPVPAVRPARSCRRTRLERIWLERPWIVAGSGLGFMLLAGSQVDRVRFDYNLLNLQGQRLPAIVYGRKLVDASSRAGPACEVIAGSLTEALALEQRIRQLDTVAAVDSVAPLLTGDRHGKIELVRQIRDAATGIRFAPVDTAPVDLAALSRALVSFDQVLGAALQAVGRSGNQILEQRLLALREAVSTWRQEIVSGWPEPRAERLTHYQQALFGDLATTLAALQKQDYRTPLLAEDLPPGLRSRSIGRTGKFLLRVYPKGNVWEREAQEAFVRELRTVDPTVTGLPVRFYEQTGRLKGNFQKGAVYALLAISLMLLFHFRSVLCVFLALMPVLAGILWTLGLMAALDIAFNPVNMVSYTLLIGIGVSNGVHILNRFTEEQNPSVLGRSTGKAVLVSALTTAIGFGSLMLAEHDGIASLGQIMALGATMCMLAALTLLPSVLRLLTRSGLKLAQR